MFSLEPFKEFDEPVELRDGVYVDDLGRAFQVIGMRGAPRVPWSTSMAHEPTVRFYCEVTDAARNEYWNGAPDKARRRVEVATMIFRRLNQEELALAEAYRDLNELEANPPGISESYWPVEGTLESLKSFRVLLEDNPSTK